MRIKGNTSIHSDTAQPALAAEPHKDHGCEVYPFISSGESENAPSIPESQWSNLPPASPHLKPTRKDAILWAPSS